MNSETVDAKRDDGLKPVRWLLVFLWLCFAYSGWLTLGLVLKGHDELAGIFGIAPIALAGSAIYLHMALRDLKQ